MGPGDMNMGMGPSGPMRSMSGPPGSMPSPGPLTVPNSMDSPGGQVTSSSCTLSSSMNCSMGSPNMITSTPMTSTCNTTGSGYPGPGTPDTATRPDGSPCPVSGAITDGSMSLSGKMVNGVNDGTKDFICVLLQELRCLMET